MAEVDRKNYKNGSGMRREQKFFLLAGLILAGLALGCGMFDPVRRDIADYVNQGILNIAELEQKSLERYAAVTGPNYTTPERVYDALKNEVIPLYRRFLKGLREIRPETEEVQRVHKTYILGAESLYRGFKEKMYGIELNNETVIISANRKIERGAMENRRWREQLFALAQKHGLGKEKEGTMSAVMKWWEKVWE
jgi:hypothetical protein